MDYEQFQIAYWKVVINREAVSMDDNMDSAWDDTYEQLADKDREIGLLEAEIEALQRENAEIKIANTKLVALLQRWHYGVAVQSPPMFSSDDPEIMTSEELGLIEDTERVLED